MKQYNYDDYEIIKSKVEYIKENKSEFEHILYFDDYYLWNYVSGDYDLFAMEWDFFKDNLQEDIKAFNSEYFKITGINLNWRGSSGECYCIINNVDDLLNKIIPISDFSIHVKKYSKFIELRVYHHDCPTGSIYNLRPISERTYNKNK